MDRLHRKERHVFRVTTLRWPLGSRRRSEGLSGHRPFICLTLSLFPLLSGCEFQAQPIEDSSEPTGASSRSETEIVEMLQASAGSWNGGDLNGFLDDYWRSDELTFSGATGVTRGWDDVLARYRESYWAPGTARDSLRFEEMEVTPLGDDHALALGRYVLYRPEDGGAVASTGFFSLVLRRVDGRWKIIHDHTSAAPPDDGQGGGGS